MIKWTEIKKIIKVNYLSRYTEKSDLKLVG